MLRLAPPLRIAAAWLGLGLVAEKSFSANWPQWRGPDGQGQASGQGFPLTWSETENVIWKTAIPGRGWSSPVVWGDQIWLTSADETATSPSSEAERLTKANRRGRDLASPDEVRFRALCLDRASGRLLHNVEVHRKKDPQWIHTDNTYATPTPVIEAGRLYCHFGTFGTFCVDTGDGRVLWSNTSLQVNHDNGPVSSPVLWEDRVIFHADGFDTQFVAALNTRDGATAWVTRRGATPSEYTNLNKCYATPLVVEAGGPPVLVSNAANWLYGYDPATGTELWRHSYGTLGYSVSARPVSGEGMIFYATGYQTSQIQALRWRGAQEPEVAWTTISGGPTMASPLLVGRQLLFVNDDGILHCVDAASGAEHYRERLGCRFYAAPLAADGRCYFFGGEGVTFVLAPGEKFVKLAENRLDGPIKASPAAVDGSIFIRTDRSLYRIGRSGP